MSLDLLSQRLIEIEKMGETFNAKLLPITNKSLLVVGGQTVKDRKPQTQIKNQVCELYWNELTSEWRVKQRDYMKMARVGFGATFAKAKNYVVVTGGFTKGFIPSRKTEVFNIKNNAWTTTSDMQVARTAHSMCEVSAGAYLYAFGGQVGNEGKVDDTIERVEISTSSDLESAMGSWELVNDIKLQTPLCNIGCFPVSKSEILLFGGLDSNHQ